jgi:excinuclease ABC subunit A
LVAAGTLQEVLANAHSLTAKYLTGELSIPVPKQRVKPAEDRGWLEVLGARENNLKNIDARIPLGTLTCVTGVSGSGKSTLVDDILRRALFRKFFSSKERPGVHRVLKGFENLDKVIVIANANRPHAAKQPGDLHRHVQSHPRPVLPTSDGENPRL